MGRFGGKTISWRIGGVGQRKRCEGRTELLTGATGRQRCESYCPQGDRSRRSTPWIKCARPRNGSVVRADPSARRIRPFFAPISRLSERRASKQNRAPYRDFDDRSRLNRCDKPLYSTIQLARPAQVGAAPGMLCRPSKLLRTGRGYAATDVGRNAAAPVAKQL